MAVTDWSTTSTANQTADPAVNWQEGQNPSTINDSARAMMAQIALWRNDMGGGGTVAGTANAITLALGGTMQALTQTVLSFVAKANNTGTTTIKVDGTSALPLRRVSGAELIADEIVLGRAYFFVKNPGASEYLIVGSSPNKASVDAAAAAAAAAQTSANAAQTTATAAGTAAAAAQSTASAALLLVPAGTILTGGYATAPAGYLECNGAAVSRTTYAALFTALGTAFGTGDGTTTFNVPDMRGQFARGWDHGAGVDAGRALGSSQADDFKSHTHTYTRTNQDGAADGNGPGPTLARTQTTGVATSATGGTETRPKNVALMFIIKT